LIYLGPGIVANSRTAMTGERRVDESFFERPILNSPYLHPVRHWELDADRQPTNHIAESRRRCDLITPVPMPQRRRRAPGQAELGLGADDGLSTPEQQYDVPRIINEIRGYVDNWRRLPNPNQWQVTPETARLLQHWRHHQFDNLKPFFCQIEAVETAIWLAEVASDRAAAGARIWTHIRGANKEANPELLRVALKLATGAGKTTVMAMLIAWQTVNAVRHPGTNRFSRAPSWLLPPASRSRIGCAC
jgi:type III restriction enzyme